MPKKNERVELTITGITDEGNGVGKADGFTLFVPNTAVGDRLAARVVKVQKHFGYAIVDELLEPSGDRAAPDCPVCRPCGGCTLRHITYEAELAAKELWVRDHLARIGGINAPVRPIIGSPQRDHYRNKAQYPVREEENAVRIGMFGKRSHRVVPCLDCALQPEHFGVILQIIGEFVKREAISVYNEETHTGLLRHVYIRYAEETDQTMVCLVINGDGLPGGDRLAEELRGGCPSVRSVVLNINTARTNVILGDACLTLWGEDRITDRLCGLEFALSPRSFYQVNRQAAQLLYRQAAAYAELTGTELLLDLYCGTGTIGLTMASQARALVGVEIVPEAIEDAKRNAARNGITNARFLCADANAAAQTLRQEGLRPDVVVLDPPRKGCAPEVLHTVAEMAPSRIVMISCNSATLARDLALLRELGYETLEVQPVDLFPRTAHVETVVLLRRRSGAV